MIDFTNIDDILEGIFIIINNPLNTKNLYNIFNIGNNTPIKLGGFVNILEQIIGKKAKKRFIEMQPGDVYSTYADISKINTVYEYTPKIKLKDGLSKFYNWYKTYNN